MRTRKCCPLDSSREAHAALPPHFVALTEPNRWADSRLACLSVSHDLTVGLFQSRTAPPHATGRILYAPGVCTYVSAFVHVVPRPERTFMTLRLSALPDATPRPSCTCAQRSVRCFLNVSTVCC
ncbi:unnamed protein product [Protopolystoma xenopodis]|uniref:Uncharacterized protein n=1 Tax=Protopolystoma xenopodis TaxID=117903 RepID=A0A3S5ACY4_9PLAT|nr:unnamed protein product [Protopolystoma xenopodis]